MTPASSASDGSSSSNQAARRGIVLLLLAVSIAGVAGVLFATRNEFGSSSESLLAAPRVPPSTESSTVLFTKNGVWLTTAPSVDTPPVVVAERAEIPADEEVIGISVGSEHRAYAVAALSFRPASHVVNDLIAGQPVTVTYCDIARCARAYVGSVAGKPLDIAVAGLDLADQRLVLKVGERMYVQETGAAVGNDSKNATFPYPRYHLIQTTWGRWRQLHPNTTAYVGPPSRRQDAPDAVNKP